MQNESYETIVYVFNSHICVSVISRGGVRKPVSNNLTALLPPLFTFSILCEELVCFRKSSCLMQQVPTKVEHLKGHQVIAVAAGDEFSLAVDDRFCPWGWGRAEQGQVNLYIYVSVHYRLCEHEECSAV